MKTIRKILDLLTPREQRRAYLLFIMVLLMAFLDMGGIAAIMPLMKALTNPEIVETNPYLSTIFTFFGFTSTRTFLLALSFTVLVGLLISIAFKGLTTYALLRFTHMRSHSIAKRLIQRYLSQPYDWFLSRHSADLGKTILAEIQQVVSGAIYPLVQFTAHGTVALALLTLLLILAPGLALVAIMTVGFSYTLIYVFLRRYLSRIGKARVVANRERFAVVQETFGGIKEVKLGNLERVMMNRFETPSLRFSVYQANAQQAAQLPRYAIEALVFCIIIGTLVFTTTQEAGLTETLPLLSVFVLTSYRLMPALQQVYTHLSTLRFSSPALDALHRDLIELGGDKNDDQSSSPPLQFNEKIELKNLTYTYPQSNTAALKNLNLEIPVRTTVGIVGTTGSGKTTTVDVILGLLKPQSGQLLLDGSPVSSLREWQRKIGYVPQSIYLTDDTVTANIAFGLPENEVDMDAVIRASKIANLHGFVTQQLPDGYKTLVGERGVRLSGGQRQRIGIARALYHDPDILVLDEATSALDNLTEQAVMEAVQNLGHRKTIILIAHRLTTVKDCDKICFIEGGKVSDEGTYSQLISQNKLFRDMVGKTH